MMNCSACCVLFLAISANAACGDEGPVRINMDDCVISGVVNGHATFECVLTNTTDRPFGVIADLSNISFRFKFFDCAFGSADGCSKGVSRGMLGYGSSGHTSTATLNHMLDKYPPLIIPPKASRVYKKTIARIIPSTIDVEKWHHGLVDMSVSMQFMPSLPTNYIGGVEVCLTAIEAQGTLSVDVTGGVISVKSLMKTRHGKHDSTSDRQRGGCGGESAK